MNDVDTMDGVVKRVTCRNCGTQVQGKGPGGVPATLCVCGGDRQTLKLERARRARVAHR